jgi:hypothetical protein
MPMTLHANRPLLLAMQIFHTAQRQQWCEISIEWLLIHLLLGARTLVFLVAYCRNLVCVFGVCRDPIRAFNCSVGVWRKASTRCWCAAAAASLPAAPSFAAIWVWCPARGWHRARLKCTAAADGIPERRIVSPGRRKWPIM